MTSSSGDISLKLIEKEEAHQYFSTGFLKNSGGPAQQISKTIKFFDAFEGEGISFLEEDDSRSSLFLKSYESEHTHQSPASPSGSSSVGAGRWRRFDVRESAATPSSPRTIIQKMPADIMTLYGSPSLKFQPFLTLLLLI